MGDWLKDPFMWAKQKSGIVWTEFEKTKNLLELYLNAKLLDTETVSLYKGGPVRTYYKLQVTDMWQAYAVMYDSLRFVGEW